MESNWTANQNMDWDKNAMKARANNQVGDTNFGFLWEGYLVVGGSSPVTPGAISFGTRSDDGSVFWVDKNQNGSFESGDLIVDNKGPHGQRNVAGSVTLAAGNYKFAIAFYDSGGGIAMRARWKQGTETNYNNMPNWINPGAHANMFLREMTPGSGPSADITSATTASATVGQAFNFQVTSSITASYYAYNLPPGLTCNLSTGLISGTPTAGGVYAATVLAEGASASATGSLTITLPTSAPIVSASAATEVTANGAKLNGDVNSTGGSDPVVTLYLGTTDRGTSNFGWSEGSTPLGNKGAGSIVQTIAGLNLGTTFHYRFKAVNSGGTAWSNPKSFTTESA
ncbi:uncharacterized protein METZ01_LOCUS328926, partial [marine metagenome]